ncbi:MAG: DEAD/DEAH box helicase [Terrimesophilobacter sp.]
MPNFKKTPSRAPRSAVPAHKPGSKSPKHRGFRAAEAAATPAKKRWNADDRARRSETPSTDRRPDWQPNAGAARADRSARPERGGYSDRPARPERGGYTDRPARDDRAPRTGGYDRPARTGGFDRPARDDRAPRTGGFDRTDRAPRTGGYDRTDRPARTGGYDRPARDDRAPRTGGFDRTARPARDDRAPRTGGFDRTDRPARTGGYDRPVRDDRAPRTDRFDRSDRPARAGGFDRSDRAPRAGGYERPARTGGYERPERRSHDSRPPREERPRRDSDFYPAKDAGERFSAHEDVVLERLEADAIQASDVEGVTFGDLGLGANIVRELATLGAASPFPIQAATIPDVLKGMDVLGRGKTGSGKTIAFGAPMVERLMENFGAKGRKPGRTPRALILAPTRELALQIDRTIQPIARSVGLFTTQIYGGVPQHRQVSALQRGVDIVIGTPGRIEDLIDQGRLDLSDVTITVIDEADHMCDLGFLEPVQRILKETSPGGQKLLFSATLDKGVASLVSEFLVNPSVHEVAGEDQASSTIDHRVLLIEQRDKRSIIEQLASGDGKTLIFARTRAFAEELAENLTDAGIPAVSLHGDLNQARRTRNLERLTSGRVNVLVATDVAARGIHVDDISLVIQADPPDEYKSYLHRAGRTGRAGKAGTVVTLVNNRRRRKMDELLGRAEIKPRFDEVRPGDDLIGKLAAL